MFQNRFTTQELLQLSRKIMSKNNIVIAFLFSFGLAFSASADYRAGQDAYSDGNYLDAVFEWTTIAENGDSRAQYNLGWMNANGKGIPQDLQAAVNWYTSAAEQGYIHAQYNLANLYLRGQGVTQNDKLAFSWFIKAAEQGDAPAQYNLGRMYLLGKGGDKNIIEARFWIKQALENNDEYIGTLAQQVWDDFKLGTY